METRENHASVPLWLKFQTILRRENTLISHLWHLLLSFSLKRHHPFSVHHLTLVMSCNIRLVRIYALFRNTWYCSLGYHHLTQSCTNSTIKLAAWIEVKFLLKWCTWLHNCFQWLSFHEPVWAVVVFSYYGWWTLNIIPLHGFYCMWVVIILMPSASHEEVSGKIDHIIKAALRFVPPTF